MIITDSELSGQLDLTTGGAIVLNNLNASANAVNITAGGAITDGNDDTAGNNITAGVLTITGDQAVTGIETAVATLDLATATTSITETDGVIITDSELGQLDLTTGGAIVLNNLNASANAVNITAGGAITDGNDDTAGNNITAGVLTITGDQAVTGIETAVATLDLANATTSITETDGVIITDSELSGQLDLTTGGAIVLNNLNASANAVNITAGGAITDGNDDTAGNNITAGVLTITGDHAVTGIETAVATLDLATAATSITETDGVIITDSELSGPIRPHNRWSDCTEQLECVSQCSEHHRRRSDHRRK